MVDDDRSKDLKEKGKTNANVNGKVALGPASGSRSSSRTSSSRSGKGKERERERERGGDSVHDTSAGGAVGRREDEDRGAESFLPTYVYDTMKVKKRFEHSGYLSLREIRSF